MKDIRIILEQIILEAPSPPKTTQDFEQIDGFTSSSWSPVKNREGNKTIAYRSNKDSKEIITPLQYHSFQGQEDPNPETETYKPISSFLPTSYKPVLNKKNKIVYYASKWNNISPKEYWEYQGKEIPEDLDWADKPSAVKPPADNPPPNIGVIEKLVVGTIKKSLDTGILPFVLRNWRLSNQTQPTQTQPTQTQPTQTQPTQTQPTQTKSVAGARNLVMKVGDKWDLLRSLTSDESTGIDDYNRGVADDTPVSKRKHKAISTYTVQKILDLQKSGELGAVGKFQIIPTSMREAVKDKRIGVKPDDIFDENTQRKLFTYGILKRPMLMDYLEGKSDDEDAAVLAMAKEFAALPMTSGKGYHDGDSAGNLAKGGKDKAEEVREALRGTRKLFKQLRDYGNVAIMPVSFEEQLTINPISTSKSKTPVPVNESCGCKHKGLKSRMRKKIVQRLEEAIFDGVGIRRPPLEAADGQPVDRTKKPQSPSPADIEDLERMGYIVNLGDTEQSALNKFNKLYGTPPLERKPTSFRRREASAAQRGYQKEIDVQGTGEFQTRKPAIHIPAFDTLVIPPDDSSHDSSATQQRKGEDQDWELHSIHTLSEDNPRESRHPTQGPVDPSSLRYLKRHGFTVTSRVATRQVDDNGNPYHPHAGQAIHTVRGHRGEILAVFKGGHDRPLEQISVNDDHWIQQSAGIEVRFWLDPEQGYTAVDYDHDGEHRENAESHPFFGRTEDDPEGLQDRVSLFTQAIKKHLGAKVKMGLGKPLQRVGDVLAQRTVPREK